MVKKNAGIVADESILIKAKELPDNKRKKIWQDVSDLLTQLVTSEDTKMAESAIRREFQIELLTALSSKDKATVQRFFSERAIKFGDLGMFQSYQNKLLNDFSEEAVQGFIYALQNGLKKED